MGEIMNLRKAFTFWGAIAALLAFLTVPSFAGLGLGGSIQGTFFETDGTETLKSSKKTTSATEDAGAIIPSAYIQWEFGPGFVIGYEMVPGSAELGSNLTDDCDTRGDDAAGLPGACVGGTKDVKAEVEDVNTLYLETPGFGPAGFFASAGWTRVTIVTTETLTTGATYGNADVDAGTFGLGFKRTLDNGIHAKFTATYTDFEEVSLSSSGSDAVTTITGEPEAWGAKFTIGYQF
tara:strand:+ start:732 stop:1436 length:705 start_codon:yes stop_codon:yes gene_type:complete